jgi:probable HAF family extracellular repeat protein
MPISVPVTVPVAAPALAPAFFGAEPALRLRFTEIMLPGSVQFPTAWGIDDAGDIDGWYYDASSIEHGYIYAGGVLTNIDDPSGTPTLPRGISRNGAFVVGEYTKPSGDNHGFVYSGGTFTDVGTDTLNGANGVNDAGLIVGSYAHCQYCPSHGFLFDGTTYTTIDVPHMSETSIVAINDHGVMLMNGVSNGNVYHAFTYDGKTFTKIDVPGASNTFAEGINDRGDVVLSYTNKKVFNGAAILHAGTFTTYYLPGAAIQFTGGVNDKRTIVGTSDDSGAFEIWEVHY